VVAGIALAPPPRIIDEKYEAGLPGIIMAEKGFFHATNGEVFIIWCIHLSQLTHIYRLSPGY
jgi:hypothetical protein